MRHFKEPIPLQTTAINEVSTILGGADHVAEEVASVIFFLCSQAASYVTGKEIQINGGQHC